MIRVAVGILRDRGGRILLSRRAPGSHQGGLWEFPGGKVETGETTAEALRREFLEELGTRVLDSTPFLEVRHDYGDKAVLLDIHRIDRWEREPEGLESQPLAWVAVEDLGEFAFPAANAPIVKALLSEAPA